MPGQLGKYQEFIDDAVKKGAKILTGGKASTTLNGHFFEPTILIDVNHSMKVMKEETFGPVMAIMKVKSDEEAVRVANDSVYGLSCSIFSRNYNRAAAIGEQISAGATIINDWGLAMMVQSLPFGGVKVSGFGKFNGPEGLRDFCYQKAYVTDKYGFSVPAPKQVLCYPTTPGAHKLAVEFIKIVYEQGIGAKTGAVLRLLKKIVTRNFDA